MAEYGSWMFMLGALGMALLLGSINGLAITWGKVVPFIATLAMLTIARGLALWMSEKTPISLIELDILQSFGSGRVLGVPVPALVFVAVTIAGWVLLNRTTFGRRAIAVGGNRSAARIAGIRPGRVVFAVYRAHRAVRWHLGHPAVGPAGQRLPGRREPGRAGRDRRRGHRRDRPDRRQGHGDRHLLRRHHLRR